MERKRTARLAGIALVLTTAGPASALTGDCGQPIGRGASPAASDALMVLKSAIAVEECGTEVCDVTANCRVTASDAKRVLYNSLGIGEGLECRDYCEPVACEFAQAPVCGGVCAEGSVCLPADTLQLSRRAEHRDGAGDEDEEREARHGGSRENCDSEDDAEDDAEGEDPDEPDSDDDADGDDEAEGDDRPDGDSGGEAGCVCVDASSLPTTSTTSTTLPPRPTTTTTSTTVEQPSPSSTTTTTTTTSTTLPPRPTTTTTTTTVVDIDPGRALYDDGCAACHKAGGYDPDGFAPDLKGDGRKLEADLTDITGSHAAIPQPPGPSLSTQELAELKAFLDALAQ